MALLADTQSPCKGRAAFEDTATADNRAQKQKPTAITISRATDLFT